MWDGTSVACDMSDYVASNLVIDLVFWNTSQKHKVTHCTLLE